MIDGNSVFLLLNRSTTVNIYINPSGLNFDLLVDFHEKQMHVGSTLYKFPLLYTTCTRKERLGLLTTNI